MTEDSLHPNILDPETSREWLMLLFVSGENPQVQRNLEKLEKGCQKLIPGRFKIETVNILNEPKRAREFDIIATPTLIRCRPGPECRVVGDLRYTDRIMAILGLGV